LRALSGRLSAQGSNVDLADVSAKLAGGRLTAAGQLSLAQADAAPVALAIDLREADVAEVARLLSFGEDTITGHGEVRGPIRGKLDPRAEFLPGADMELDFALHDGVLPHLPELLQLARLPSLEGILGLFGRAMPYRTMDGTVTIRDRVLRTERFALLGPELRILAAGDVDLKSPEKTTDLVVALLFVQTLDRVIQRVPVLGSWVLGKDQNLLAVSLRVQGPWADPQVRPMALNALQAAADWAGRVIARSLRSLRDLGDLVIPGGGGDEDDKKPEDESAPPSDAPSTETEVPRPDAKRTAPAAGGGISRKPAARELSPQPSRAEQLPGGP
jgi:uncharacterized protein YhdP